MLHNKIPDYTSLRVFGCLCYATNLDPKKKKFDDRALKGVFLGYATGYKGYKVYDLEKKRIFISRDVKFHENIFPLSKTNISKTDSDVSDEPVAEFDIYFRKDVVKRSDKKVDHLVQMGDEHEILLDGDLEVSETNLNEERGDGEVEEVGDLVSSQGINAQQHNIVRSSVRDRKQPGWLKDFVTFSDARASKRTPPPTYPFAKYLRE
ncbi:Retrovirus-related Pol polyprotein from transposon TNT 1-94 [Senna tora]|uniref:Retrovirus-related Pol polyprotein from transposon TNT 1-94 n=1 Tax=Senna tora TaxID=362788 RepID=A0A835CFH3_9FABA|nr:Retrovirus-related Pol polyprotein from transposon TNT 1-94 [Senna tora]